MADVAGHGGCRPVNGALLRVDGLCVAVVQAVGAVFIGLRGHFTQLHSIHCSRHTGTQRWEEVEKSGFLFRVPTIHKAAMCSFLNLR